MKNVVLLLLFATLIVYPQGWTEQMSGTGENLLGVTMSDANNATAYGMSGTILRTTNGGADWLPVVCPVTNNLIGASFYDADNGLAFGNGGVILKTTDGGASWSSLVSGTYEDLYGMSYLNSTTAWVVGDHGYIAVTTDGGVTWTPQASGVGWVPLIGVHFYDAANGIAAGYYGTILKTTNGGANWASQSTGTFQDLYRPVRTEPNCWTVTGYHGTILRSTDDGVSWLPQSSGTTQMLREAEFTDANNGWICGNSGTILKTTNAGANWSVVTVATGEGFFGIDFADANHGIVVGLSGVIFGYNGLPEVPSVSPATEIMTTSFNANWYPAGLATGYKLDVATDNLFTSFVTGYNNLDVGNVLTYPVTGLTPGTEYFYRVRAYNALGESGNSSTINLLTMIGIPDPTTISITRYAFRTDWDAVAGADGYYLDVCYDNVFTEYVTGFNNLDIGNVTTYVASGLIPGYTYYYRLRAYYAGGTGNNSDTVTVTLLPPLADLEIIAAVDKANPINLEVLTYTFTLTNLGPDTAKAVILQAAMPRGFVYASSNAVNSTFNPGTGAWTLPEVFPPNAVAVLTFVDSVDYFDQAYDFRDFYEINLFARNDATLTGVFNGGKIAAGDDLSIVGSNFGGQLRTRPVTPDVVIAGDDLYFESGTVYYGNVVYGNTTNLPNGSVNYPNGSLIQASPLNFASLNSYLNSLSTGIRGYDINGITTFNSGNLTLEGTDLHLNVFNVSEAQFEGAGNILIDIPRGAVALINVSGSTIEFTGTVSMSDSNLGNYVLFNFSQASIINFTGANLYGSVLAPGANVSSVGSLYRGQMFVNNIITNSSHQNHSFLGFIPLNRTIGFLPEVVSSFSIDPDQTNNDDPAVVVINTTAPYGTGGNGTWAVASILPVNEMVISMVRKDANTILAGTNLGHIIEMDNSGVLGDTINASMTPVAYIHDLAVTTDGNIFAATESGLYRSTDDGATWITHLNGKEVRSILLGSDGYMYAGTWSFGVYRSADGGYTWIQKNDNLASTVITSMMHRVVGGPQYTVFAGTIGAGVASTIDYANTWMNLAFPYEFVTCMDKTNEGIIFVGTLADGVYRSYDNGNTWTKMSGVPDGPIYAVRIDAENNIFVSSWMFGIYGSADLGDSWAYLGLGGYGISASFPGPDGKLFASSAGKLLVNNSPITSIKKNGNGVPAEFALEQNYPNPFNPSTKIKFSVPAAKSGSASQRVTLSVFDILGREVAVLVNEDKVAGYYEVEFGAQGFSSGIYFCQLKAGKVPVVITKKMLLVK